MIDMPAALAAHLQQDVTTLCHCWTLTRRDGATFGFTDHDSPIDIGGVIHSPQTGFTPSEVEAGLGMAIAGSAIEGALSADVISADDLAAGLFDGADIVLWLVNWDDAAMRAKLRTAHVARIEQADGVWRAELEDLAAEYAVPRGRYFRRQCDAELGDSACGVAVLSAAYSAVGTVVSVAGDGTVEATGLAAFGGGWFRLGRLEWLGGANAGQTSSVAQDVMSGAARYVTPGTVPLHPPVAGDTFRLVAGCDKSFATCKAKFANGLNFQGFPHMPGNDVAYGYVSEGQAFDGGVIVP